MEILAEVKERLYGVSRCDDSFGEVLADERDEDRD